MDFLPGNCGITSQDESEPGLFFGMPPFSQTMVSASIRKDLLFEILASTELVQIAAKTRRAISMHPLQFQFP
jgi:hypothetical protein